VDGARNAYVVGFTQSSDFPATPGAFQTRFFGSDAFVAKIINQPSIRTITVLDSSAASTVYGEPITFTATVTDAATGLPLTSGDVQFSDSQGYYLGTATLDSTGVATLTTSMVSAGASWVSAHFIGSGVYGPSSAHSLPLSIAQAQASTQVTSSPNPSAPGQAVTITATVTVNPPGEWVPGGTVTFVFGRHIVTRNLDSNGQATFTMTPGPYRTATITAVFDLGSNYLWSNASVVHQVAQVSTTTSLASSPNPSMSGQPVTFTATVTAVTAALRHQLEWSILWRGKRFSPA
jgi:hypothetical protein